MKSSTAKQAGLTKSDIPKLSARDLEYLNAWETMDSETRNQMRVLGIHGPDLGKQNGPVNRANEERDVFSTIASPISDRYFDEPEETEEIQRTPQEIALRILHVIAGSKQPGLQLASECLLAIINRSGDKTQADIARRFGLTRAAVNKRMAEMRSGDLSSLQIYFFGGGARESEAARTRAIRVHKQTKQTKCKTSISKTQNQTSLILATF